MFKTSFAAAACVATLTLAGCGDESHPVAGEDTDPTSATGDEAATDSEGDDGLAIGQQVPWPTDEWTVVPPQDMGMDAAILEGAFDYAFADGKNTQGVIVIRGGAIVAERYADERDPQSFAASWSAGKSFASTLIGIAIDEGRIPGVAEPMSSFFPSWAGTDKGAITLENVLQMESGIDFVEDYADIAESDVIAMGLRDDPLDYMMGQPVTSAPGSYWYYSSGDTMFLSGVVEAATGMSAADYAQDRLFSKIGMKNAQWWRDGADHALTFCCLDAPSREFAKFGLLFLRNGQWDGQTVVSESWVHAATTTRAKTYPGYAYQWWTVEIDEGSPLPADTYSARGLDEQLIYVIPSLDLVVIRNGMYDKPPGDPVASGGYLKHFMPRGLAEHGTLSPTSWLDAQFLAPVINSIEGTEKIDPGPDPGAQNDWGDDASLVCSEAASEYPAYCAPVHGCACDLCPDEFLSCDDNPGCKEIIGCALEIGCRGVACAGACGQQIEDNGGVFGAAAMMALALSDCVSTCATECD